MAVVDGPGPLDLLPARSAPHLLRLAALALAALVPACSSPAAAEGQTYRLSTEASAAAAPCPIEARPLVRSCARAPAPAPLRAGAAYLYDAPIEDGQIGFGCEFRLCVLQLTGRFRFVTQWGPLTRDEFPYSHVTVQRRGDDVYFLMIRSTDAGWVADCFSPAQPVPQQQAASFACSL